MDTFINSLCSSLSLNANWGVVGTVIPFLAISVLFGLGVFLIDGIIWNIHYAGSGNGYFKSGVIHRGHRVL